ncbi:MAG TPA: hypothetical protein VFS08_05390 [Gemmatimonadaceae bacterium]|nr:hypothetical protein [Gemmatimonadaceae bacterium]
MRPDELDRNALDRTARDRSRAPEAPVDMTFVRRFRGPDATAVFRVAGAALGDDAVVLRTTARRDAEPAERVEVAAATAADVERFRTRLAPTPLVTLDRRRAPRERPLVLALVGPGGAGRTSVLEALVGADSFAGWRVGLLTLDTRAGALERLQARAGAARLPLEVVYDAAEAAGALRRLSRCDVVLVDTPPLSLHDDAGASRTAQVLDALAPDERHLVVSAAMRPDLAAPLRMRAGELGATHALLAKLDELPGGEGVAELAGALALPLRWVSDAARGSVAVHAAMPRLLAALGAPLTHDAPAPPPRAPVPDATPARQRAAAPHARGPRRRIGILSARLG